MDLNCDQPTGVECPTRDCTLMVVYNGNYFCEAVGR